MLRALIRIRPVSSSILVGGIRSCPQECQRLTIAAFSTRPFSRRDRPTKKKSDGGLQKSSNDPNKLVRLSKRMSELDICSRREADRFILEGRVLLSGQPVDPIMGQKVSAQEKDIALLSSAAATGDKTVQARANEFSWESLQTAAVVLHKPVGFVSGQPEGPTAPNADPYTPAVRLLTPPNAHIQRSNYPSGKEYQQAKTIVQKQLEFAFHHSKAEEETLQNCVPAGRLDFDSSGLLIFTNQGVVAKKLISDRGQLEKEYWVVLEPLQGLTREEAAKGMKWLPQPNRNLKLFRRGGVTLFGDTRPLRPVVDAEWLSWNDATPSIMNADEILQANARRKLLRLVLKEGRKHQIRRMCRELLGLHVVQLVRTKIGPIELNSLPEGKWRPLRQQEMEAIFFSGR